VSQQIQHQSADVRVRRAPKFGAFMVVGGGLGAIVTLVLTSLFPSDPNVGFIALFAYFCLYGIPAGVVLGALVALILDRRSSKRARTVAAEHESVEPPAE
jgi:NhaP-type Na+/H+ or K+/H+ antiporter